jgi:aminopeptidase N
MYSTMTYRKGSLVLRMLRDELGEETFRRGLREYYQRFRFRQVTGADFKRVMEDVSGRDLSDFFRRWITTAEGRVGGRPGR